MEHHECLDECSLFIIYGISAFTMISDSDENPFDLPESAEQQSSELDPNTELSVESGRNIKFLKLHLYVSFKAQQGFQGKEVCVEVCFILLNIYANFRKMYYASAMVYFMFRLYYKNNFSLLSFC